MGILATCPSEVTLGLYELLRRGCQTAGLGLQGLRGSMSWGWGRRGNVLACSSELALHLVKAGHIILDSSNSIISRLREEKLITC